MSIIGVLSALGIGIKINELILFKDIFVLVHFIFILLTFYLPRLIL